MIGVEATMMEKAAGAVSDAGQPLSRRSAYCSGTGMQGSQLGRRSEALLGALKKNYGNLETIRPARELFFSGTSFSYQTLDFSVFLRPYTLLFIYLSTNFSCGED